MARDSSDPEDSSYDPARGLSLRGLGPKYVPEDHSTYVDLVLRGIFGGDSKTDKGPARNIAVTGRYGSGKSSVLAEVESRLGGRAVGVSLSTLTTTGEDDAMAPTSLIQKEIVKQLVYGAATEETPDSRFRRIEPFRARSGFYVGLAVAVAAFITFMASGLTDTLTARLTNDSESVARAVAVILAGGIGIAAYHLARILHSRIRINAISAASASISLASPDRDYFDQFLDEIVYFFQITDTIAVIFEDIDRFRDADIFDSLRGLNDLLNRSERVRQTVTFVYAVRDSVFEDASQTTGTSREVIDIAGARTKFFDLIIPIVPFVTHRNARDLLTTLFSEGTSKTSAPKPLVQAAPPSDRVLTLVAPFITDMRLMTNIVNEYKVFAGRVLGEPLNLDPDHLFAMIAYKNFHPGQFEKVSEGSSEIDGTFDAIDRTIRATVLHLGDQIVAVRSTDRAEKRTRDLRAEAEQRLRSFVGVAVGLSGSGYQVDDYSVAAGGKAERIGDVTETFWDALSTSTVPLEVTSPLGFSSSIPLELVRRALGTAFPAVSLTARLAEEKAAALETLIARREFVRWQPLSELLMKDDLRLRRAQQDLEIREEEGSTPDREIELIDLIDQNCASPIGRALIRSGYIDRNFALYIAQYLGVMVSPNVMTFILRHADRGTSNPLYTFEGDREIEALLAEFGDELADQPAVMNSMVMDFLARNRSDLLGRAGDVVAGAGDDAIEFLELYFANGLHQSELAAVLAPRYPGFLEFLAGLGGLPKAQAPGVLDATLANIASTEIGENPGGLRALLDQNGADMAIWSSSATSVDQASRIAEVLATAELPVNDLASIASPLQRELARRGHFEFTANNLKAAAGTDHVPTIDSIRALGEAAETLLVQHFGEYLALVAEGDAQTCESDDAVRSFSWAIDVVPESLGAMVRLSDPGVRIADVNEVSDEAWDVLADNNRIDPSVDNLLALSKAIAADTVARWLSPQTIHGEGSSNVTDAAVYIANASQIDRTDRERNLEAIKYPPVPPTLLEIGSADVIDILIREGMVPNTLETLSAAVSVGPDTGIAALASLSSVDTMLASIRWEVRWLGALLQSESVDLRVREMVSSIVLDDPRSSQATITEAAHFILKSGLWVDADRRRRILNEAVEEAAVAFLVRDYSEMTYDQISAVLAARGGEYARLTTSGGSGVVLRDTTSNSALIDLLAADPASPVNRRDTDRDGNPRSPLAHDGTPD